MDFEIKAKEFFIEQGLETIKKDDELTLRYSTVGVDFIKDTNLSLCSIKVFLYISMASGSKCYSYYSQESISEEIGYSRKQVNRAIKELEEAGYIRIKSFKTKNNMKRNVYVLCYSPYLKKQYKTSPDKSKPAEKRPVGLDMDVHLAGSKRLQEKERIKEKDNSKATTILFKEVEDNRKPLKQVRFESDGTKLSEDKQVFLQRFMDLYPEVKIRDADLKELEQISLSDFVRYKYMYWRFYVKHTDDNWIKNNGSLDLLLLLRNQSKFEKFITSVLLYDDKLKLVNNSISISKKDDVDYYNKEHKNLNIRWKLYKYEDNLFYALPYSTITGATDVYFKGYDLYCLEDDKFKLYIESSILNPKNYYKNFIKYSDNFSNIGYLNKEEIKKIEIWMEENNWEKTEQQIIEYAKILKV